MRRDAARDTKEGIAVCDPKEGRAGGSSHSLVLRRWLVVLSRGILDGRWQKGLGGACKTASA